MMFLVVNLIIGALLTRFRESPRSKLYFLGQVLFGSIGAYLACRFLLSLNDSNSAGAAGGYALGMFLGLIWKHAKVA